MSVRVRVRVRVRNRFRFRVRVSARVMTGAARRVRSTVVVVRVERRVTVQGRARGTVKFRVGFRVILGLSTPLGWGEGQGQC